MVTTRETLLSRLKAVDRHDAWQEFFRLYHGAILRFARTLGLTEHKAKDVLQDTMLELIRVLPHFNYDRQRGSFRGLLLRIVRHKSIDVMRRVQRESGRQVPWLEATHGHDIADECAEPDAETRARWRAALLAAALDELHADPGLEAHTFAVFEAYVQHRKPAQEVAVAFGLTPNAVYQIKDRLLRRLRNRVAQLMRDSGE